MFKHTLQSSSSLLCVLHASGSSPLQLWSAEGEEKVGEGGGGGGGEEGLSEGPFIFPKPTHAPRPPHSRQGRRRHRRHHGRDHRPGHHRHHRPVHGGHLHRLPSRAGRQGRRRPVSPPARAGPASKAPAGRRRGGRSRSHVHRDHGARCGGRHATPARVHGPEGAPPRHSFSGGPPVAPGTGRVGLVSGPARRGGPPRPVLPRLPAVC